MYKWLNLQAKMKYPIETHETLLNCLELLVSCNSEVVIYHESQSHILILRLYMWYNSIVLNLCS